MLSFEGPLRSTAKSDPVTGEDDMKEGDDVLLKQARAALEPLDGTGPHAVWKVWITELELDDGPPAQHAREGIKQVLSLRDAEPTTPVRTLVSRVIQQRYEEWERGSQ